MNTTAEEAEAPTRDRERMMKEALLLFLIR
jgi:hypothetical protein